MGQVYSEHIEETLKLDDDSPLSLDERRRRVVQLCCSFLRNLAFHRAGLDSEVQSKLLDPKHPHATFWLEVRGNFFDTAVLEWCKLFGDRKGKHRWRLVIVENPDGFETDLFTKLGVTADEFTALITRIKDYRDQFVAHLDEEKEMLFPDLEVAKGAIGFLHERLVQLAAADGVSLGIPTTPEQLNQGFEQAFREARGVYATAMAAPARC
jgi:hypothetical protein